MLKKTLIAFALPLLLLVIVAASLCRGALGSSPTAARRHSAVATAPSTGTLQKLIVESGSATMNLDVNRLNGFPVAGIRDPGPKSLEQLHFAVAANSFFPVLVFNDQLRGPEPGSLALVPIAGGGDPGIADAGYSLPPALSASLNQLIIEKSRFQPACRKGFGTPNQV